MGSIIAEIIKEIPLSAVLKEKLLGMEAKLLETETKVSLFEIELRKAQTENEQIKGENQRLKDTIASLTKSPDVLHPTAYKVLTVFAQHTGSVSKRGVLNTFQGGDRLEADYYFDELAKDGYIRCLSGTGSQYSLHQKGKKYLLDNPTT